MNYIFFHHYIKIKLSWFLWFNCKLMFWCLFCRSWYFEPKQSTLNYFINQYFRIITWKLITIQKQFVLFKKLISFNGISRQKYLTARRHHMRFRSIWSISIKKLYLKIDIFIGTWRRRYLLDFSQFWLHHRSDSKETSSRILYYPLLYTFILLLYFEFDR